MTDEKDGGGLELTPVGQHEFNNPDRTGAHRLVATSILVTALILAINQDWWKHAESWAFTKTHPPGSPGAADLTTIKQFTPQEVAQVMKWLVAIGALWIILTLMIDLGDTTELAVALGLVIMSSIILTEGPSALSGIGIPTTPGGK